MSSTASPAQSPHTTLELAFGVALVIFGVVLTLDALGVGEVTRLLRIWPAALVLAGVVALGRARDRGARLWAWAWIVIGGWLLLRSYGLTRVGFWELVWPVALIAVGVKLGLDAWRRPPADGASLSALPSAASHLIAILGGSKRQVQERPFLGASMTACLGGCELDLRHAHIAPGDQAVVEVFALLGGHEIRVPEHWAVVSQITPVAASIEDKRGVNVAAESTAPTLVLRGLLIMSGLTLR
jgi:hypothetical protein